MIRCLKIPEKEDENYPSPPNRLICVRMKNKWIAYSLLILLLLVAGFYLYNTFREKHTIDSPNHFEIPEPKFRHDGDLVVYKGKTKDTATALEIEVVDDAYEITTGLMFRKKMEPNRGMLFLFQDVDMRSFWMKNTHIPLDIVFIAEDKTIVNIQKNTTPFSEKSVPSTGPAKYVLEVNAGTADKYGWKEGDGVTWNLK